MKISEVSDRCDLSIDTLRYYERIGLIPPVHRNEGGIRDYSDLDIRRVEFVKCLRSAGLPIEVLSEYFALVEQGDQTAAARKQILIDQREQLLARIAEMQETADLLAHKIEVYEDIIMDREKEIEIYPSVEANV